MKVEKLTSKEAAAELEKVQEELRENRERRAEIQPPATLRWSPTAGEPPPHMAREPLLGAGPVWLEAHEAGDREKLAALDRERQELASHADHLKVQRHQLKLRVKAAQAEEEREAAPRVAKEAAKALDGALDRLEAAYAELREAESERDRLVNELRGARKLAGPDSAALTPEQLHRLHAGPEGGEIKFEWRDSHTGQAARNGRLIRDVRALLPPLDNGLIDRVRRFLGSPNALNMDAKSPREAEVRKEADIVRARLIAAARFDELADAEEMAWEAIKERSRGRRRQPDRDSWLRSRRRDKIAQG